MKAGDAMDISRIWQLSHLEYYFGATRATTSMENVKLTVIVRNSDSVEQDCVQDNFSNGCDMRVESLPVTALAIGKAPAVAKELAPWENSTNLAASGE